MTHLRLAAWVTTVIACGVVAVAVFSQPQCLQSPCRPADRAGQPPVCTSICVNNPLATYRLPLLIALLVLVLVVTVWALAPRQKKSARAE